MANVVRLDEIREELLDLEGPEERIQYLVEIGQTLPSFPASQCIEVNRVLGCQSMVWLIAEAEGDRLRFRATSDAPMVRGLIAILLAAYSGKSPQEILDFPIEPFFAAIRLQSFITPMRSNGLRSMVNRILALARERGGVPDLPTATPAAASRLAVQDATPWDPNLSRADFPILSRLVAGGQPLAYLDNAASTQRPRAVIDAMSDAYARYYANVHRGGHELAAETTIRFEEARRRIQSFVNAAESSEILFTAGTTAAINLVARTWGDTQLRAGDEILLTEMEHHSNIVPWQQLAQRTGCVVRWLPLRDDFQLDLEQLPRFLSQRTRLVAVTAVSNVLGTINPIAEIIAAAHACGAKVLVDGAQAVPHDRIDVRGWDADFLAFSGHKMLGPTGIGILYGKRELLDAMPPFQGGGSMIKLVTQDGFTCADLPYKFEAGTPPIVEAIGLTPAVDYLERIGLPRILAHEQRLARHARNLLAEIPGIRFFGPPPEPEESQGPAHRGSGGPAHRGSGGPAHRGSGGIVTFGVEGLHPDEIAHVLDSHGIAVRAGHHCAMPLHARLGIPGSCRASFYLYNTMDEVERLVEGVRSSLRILKRK